MNQIASVADRLTTEIPELLAEHDVPGAAVGICDTSRLLWARGFGSTGREAGHPVSPQTMFSVQSVSKTYTATAVMLAAQDGLLDLDAPITRYLPGFTVNSVWEERPELAITIRRLLGHKAGFTHEAPVGSNYRSSRSWARHLASISDTWLRFPVGHHHEYSNLGVDLAGHVVERVTGRPFHAFVRDRLLEPLGMTRTTFNQRAIAAEADRAVGHDPKVKRRRTWIPIIPSGGLYASVEDVCRFVRFHLAEGEHLIDTEHLAGMYEVPDPEPEQDLGYGLGVANLRLAGRPLRGHGGGGFGFCCNVLWSPERPIGMVVLTNAAALAPTMQLSERIVTELLGGGSQPPVPGQERQRFAGRFVGRLGAVDGSDLPYDGPQIRYRLDGDHLIRNDGITYYRNDAPDIGADAEPDGPWNRDYKITIAGSTVDRARLLREGDKTAIEFSGDGVGLNLRRHRSDLYFSSTGEALDLGRGQISYAYVPLQPL